MIFYGVTKGITRTRPVVLKCFILDHMAVAEHVLVEKNVIVTRF